MFETVYRHLIRYLWPSLYNSNLERVLYPPNSFLYSGDRFYFTYPQSSRARGLVEVFTLLRVLLVLLGPVAFEVYAFVRLTARYGFTDAVLLMSLLLSTLLIIAAIIYFYLAYTEYPDVEYKHEDSDSGDDASKPK